MQVGRIEGVRNSMSERCRRLRVTEHACAMRRPRPVSVAPVSHELGRRCRDAVQRLAEKSATDQVPRMARSRRARECLSHHAAEEQPGSVHEVRIRRKVLAEHGRHKQVGAPRVAPYSQTYKIDEVDAHRRIRSLQRQSQSVRNPSAGPPVVGDRATLRLRIWLR